MDPWECNHLPIHGNVTIYPFCTSAGPGLDLLRPCAGMNSLQLDASTFLDKAH
jgi:hypothetical protein